MTARPTPTEPIIVRGHPLDRQQMAVVEDQSFTQLVVAGAGTGKTTTLIGKVKYLAEKAGVDPDRMLLISLTNNSVADLRKAVAKEFGPGFGADIMTIHALGNRILRKKPCIGAQKAKLIGGICDELVQTDRKSAEAMMAYIDGLRRTSYSYLSYNGKSIGNRGLRAVADALFRCGIDCDYTRPVYSETDSRPGFITVKLKNSSFKLYSDSPGVSDAGRDPDEAWAVLKAKKVPAKTLNVNDLASNVMQAWGLRVPESLGNLISRCKCTGRSIRDLLRANGRNPTAARGEAEIKINLLDRVWDMYSMACAQGDLADYEDMVIQSADIVRRGGFAGKRYDAVLIDEYQDVSKILVDLVKALRGVMRFRLFCVGDDWQSIYSFSGGDVWQMFDFRLIWSGWGSMKISKIEKTYRSPKQMVEMTNRFVSKNPAQIRKVIRGLPATRMPPVQLLPVSEDGDIAKMIANRLDYVDPDDSVFVIGRTRRDLFALGYGNGPFLFESANPDSGSVKVVYREYDEATKEWMPVRELRYLTAHSSKGLEADVVFLLADRERGGFPNDVEDDLGILFAGREEGIEYAEERRVFYVAMTRARKKLFMVNRIGAEGTALSSDSPFMGEIISDNLGMLEKSTPSCPVCSGPMMIRDSPKKPFYGCLNYPACRGTLPFRELRAPSQWAAVSGIDILQNRYESENRRPVLLLSHADAAIESLGAVERDPSVTGVVPPQKSGRQTDAAPRGDVDERCVMVMAVEIAYVPVFDGPSLDRRKLRGRASSDHQRPSGKVPLRNRRPGCQRIVVPDYQIYAAVEQVLLPDSGRPRHSPDLSELDVGAAGQEPAEVVVRMEHRRDQNLGMLHGQRPDGVRKEAEGGSHRQTYPYALPESAADILALLHGLPHIRAYRRQMDAELLSRRSYREIPSGPPEYVEPYLRFYLPQLVRKGRLGDMQRFSRPVEAHGLPDFQQIVDLFEVHMLT